MRNIAIVTGSRSEYGLLYWLMHEIKEDKQLKLSTIVTGMHLSPEFGLTYQRIEQDGFDIDEKVEMLLSSDSSVGMAKSVGVGVLGFADAYESLKPDIIVLLGDRFEILAAAQVAMMMKIPIAHISGGEITEGAIDDSIRHAITKMSNLHFVGADEYRTRVIQMGENPDTVFSIGDPGLDNIRRLNLLSLAELEQTIGFELDEKFILVTYHPITMDDNPPEIAFNKFLNALDQLSNLKIIITKPNADAGGRVISQLIDQYAEKNPENIYVTTSMGQKNYLSAMSHCSAVVGNSSSGIVEAPAFHVPTVNIGDRQKGRLKASSILDCNDETDEIVRAINKSLSAEFKTFCSQTKSLYGDCNASVKIKEKLKSINLAEYRKKQFFDIRIS